MKFVLPLLAFLSCFVDVRAEAALPQHWTLSASHSTVTFTGQQMGKSFQGSFTRFSTEIYFDPEKLDESSIKADFDLSGLSTGDKDRDKTVSTPDWFDLARFPTARFEARGFKHLEKNQYEAVGTLTIKDVSVPIVLPFTLDIDKSDPTNHKATVKSHIMLDRSKFGLGVGQWADTSVIANEVAVNIDLVAGAQ